MSRTRIVKGRYTKMVGENYNVSAEGKISYNAINEVRDNGKEKGVFYGNYEKLGSEVTDDFDIRFSLKRNKSYRTIVPFGILDYSGNSENSNFVFDYSLMVGNIDSLEFKILNEDGTTLYAVTNLPEVVISARKLPLLEVDLEKNKPIHDSEKPISTWDWKLLFDKYNTISNDYTKIGSYVIFWDGFDNDDIYNSTNFINKKLKAIIKASKKGIEKTAEVEFTTKYKEVDWVDVKIDRKNKKIDTTLRVNLKDGGEYGLKCVTGSTNAFEPSMTETKCPWDKIPSAVIDTSKPILKIRTKSFSKLKEIAFDGLKKHWSRSKNISLSIGNSVNIIGENYEVEIHPSDTVINAMNSLPIIYNTNNNCIRSGNPGGSYNDGNLDDNVMNLLPDLGVIQRLSYNVGYIYEYFYLKNWDYQTDTDEIVEFMYTAAHELGHELLQAYGGTVYSWQHKGSSYYFPQDTKPNKGNESKLDKITHLDEMETDGESYPTNGEVDVMKYYNKEPKKKSIDRTVASENDVLGLIWLTKIKIK